MCESRDIGLVTEQKSGYTRAPTDGYQACVGLVGDAGGDTKVLSLRLVEKMIAG